MPTDGRVSHHEFWSPGGAVAWAKTSKPPTVAAVARAKQEMQASAPHVLQAPGTGPAADGVGDCPGTGLRPANAGVEDCSGSAGTDQRPANAGVEDGPGSTGTEPASGERRSRGRSRQGRDQSVSWSCWIRQCRDGSASRIRWIRQAAFLCEKDERRIRRSGFPGTRPAAFFFYRGHCVAEKPWPRLPALICTAEAAYLTSWRRCKSSQRRLGRDLLAAAQAAVRGRLHDGAVVTSSRRSSSSWASAARRWRNLHRGEPS